MFFIVLVSVLLVVLYFYGRRNHDYWKVKGVKYEKPLIFFGSTLNNKIKNVCFADRFIGMYREYSNEKYVGFFEGSRPSLLIRDPDIIQHILINDFRNFHYRGANAHKEVTEPLMKNLFNVDGDTWKLLRQKMTPAFTSAKLKAMFPLIIEQAEKLLKITEGFAESEKEIDSREILARYTTDFIGACGFGINVNSQNDANSEFRKLGRLLFSRSSKRDVFVSILKRVAPNIFKSLHFFNEQVERLSFSIITNNMEQRNYKPSGRNDFVDMMLELKAKGKVVAESLEKRKADGSMEIVELEIDDELIVAQVMVFFGAGFETSSSSGSYLLHLFALNPEKQELCQQEVDAVLARHNGKLSFDSVKEMKYLEMSFKEALRLYSPVGWLQRRCVNRCQIPGTDLIIDEGVDIVIPNQALQTDEKYFDNPDEFRPERFDPDHIGDIRNGVYLPFGAGPRACIGERLGILQSIVGVAAVLSLFSVAPSKNTVPRPKLSPGSVTVSTIIGGLPLLFIKRNNN